MINYFLFNYKTDTEIILKLFLYIIAVHICSTLLRRVMTNIRFSKFLSDDNIQK